MDFAISLYSAAKMIIYVDKICAFYNVHILYVERIITRLNVKKVKPMT